MISRLVDFVKRIQVDISGNLTSAAQIKATSLEQIGRASWRERVLWEVVVKVGVQTPRKRRKKERSTET